MRANQAAVLLALLIPAAAGWAVRPFAVRAAVHSASSRGGAPRCCADDDESVPRDLNSIVEQSRGAVRDAILGGKRRLTVEAGSPTIDVSSQAYEPATLARFALEIAQALTALDGEILMLMPGMAAAMQATSLLDVELTWPAAQRELLKISSLGMQGAPAADDAVPAAVVLVGLMPAADAADASLADACAWMALPGVVSLCINSRVALPVEDGPFEAAYCLVPYTVARTDALRPEAGEENAGHAILLRAYPGEWRVYVDAARDGQFELLDALGARPSDEALSQLLLPLVEKRQTAIDALGAALGNGGATGGGAAGGGAAGAGVGPLGSLPAPSAGFECAAVDGDMPAAVPRVADGVVTNTWAEIQAAGSFGPMALYSAVVLLRMRALGGGADFGEELNGRAVHVAMPSDPADAAAGTEPSFGKLRGGVRCACLLAVDGVGAGAAGLEQLALCPEADAVDAADGLTKVVDRAVAEAAARGQAYVVVRNPPPAAESLAAVVLEAAGFRYGCEGAPPHVAAAMAACEGALCRQAD